MTRNDDTYDELMPTETNYVEHAALLGSGALATVGLAGFAVARLSTLSTLAPEVAALPHLLGASVLVFALGAGASAMAFNIFTDSASVEQVKKVTSVYLPVIGLLSALVDAGAFHPRLAMVFVCLLSASGFLYAMFRGGSVTDFGRQNA